MMKDLLNVNFSSYKIPFKKKEGYKNQEQIEMQGMKETSGQRGMAQSGHVFDGPPCSKQVAMMKYKEFLKRERQNLATL